MGVEEIVSTKILSPLFPSFLKLQNSSCPSTSPSLTYVAVNQVETGTLNSMKRTTSIFALLTFLLLTLLPGCDTFSQDEWPTGVPRERYATDKLNFMIIGDWGREGGDYQQEVADRLGMEAAADNSQFIISTGDNFYNDGVQGTTDPQWQLSFENVYTSDALSVRWYVTLGNHDHNGNTQAQIDYSSQSSRWYLPANYYTEELTLNDSSTVLFIFLDTTPFKERVFDEAEIAGATGGAPLQLKWLDETLAQSQADWKIVVGHHPLFSVGEKHQNSRTMTGNVHHLLERHNVQIYFSGHSHSLQHIKPKGKVDYLISGAGSSIRKVHPNDDTVAAESVPGFIAVSLTSNELVAQFVDFKGEMHHETVIYR